MKPSALYSIGAAASFVSAAAFFFTAHIATAGCSLAVGASMLSLAAVMRKKGR